jgi:hypothetical protein
VNGNDDSPSKRNEGGLRKRLLHIRDKTVLVTVSSKGTTAKPRLEVEAPPSVSIQEAQSLRKLILTMFASSFDFNGFR